ncbi:MAG: hypothetical protein HFF01_06105 [Erysipelotrichaceae bacterium]|nr:hypothetical protein [Erysipelotrichaceae bacterium]
MWKKISFTVIGVITLWICIVVNYNLTHYADKMHAAQNKTLDDYLDTFEYGGITWKSVLLKDGQTGEGIAVASDLLDDFRGGVSMCYPDRVSCRQSDYSVIHAQIIHYINI